jgi:hypothetical protein
MSGQVFTTLWFAFSLIMVFVNGLRSDDFVEWIVRMIIDIICIAILLIIIKFIIVVFTWALT